MGRRDAALVVGIAIVTFALHLAGLAQWNWPVLFEPVAIPTLIVTLIFVAVLS